MGSMEQFGQNDGEQFEMPQTALGVQEKVREYKTELECSEYENSSVQDKHRILDSMENKLDLMNSGLESIFVNPSADRDYQKSKELIEEQKELVFKKRRPLFH